MAGAGYKLFVNGNALSASDLNTYIQQQTVMVFADSTARATALSGVVAEGMISYLSDSNALQYYDGATWQDVSNPGDITAVTATSPLTGGGLSGAITVGIQSASTSQSGAVQLSDSTSTTSSVLAATPTAVKSAYDLAGAAIPKSTVTTSGDIIYATGSSAVTRLGVGTTGQVLGVSGGVPAWTTPSAAASGLTFISKTSWSAAASVTVDSVFTSTYQNYLIIINDWIGSAYNIVPQMQLRYGSSTSGSVIYGSSYGCPYSGSPLIFQSTTSAAAFDFWRYIGDGSGSFIHCNIERVGTGSAQKALVSGHGITDAGAEQYKFGGIWTDPQAYTGFVLKTSSGTSTGNVSVYGYAKS